MAFEKKELLNSEWTLIGSGVDSITFLNVSQFPFYVNFSDTTTPPEETIGLAYGPWQGQLKIDTDKMTYKPNPNYVFARAISRPTRLIVETE